MKKKNRMTRIAFVAAMAIVALMSPHKASAQAFDGDMDDVVHIRCVRHASCKPLSGGFLLFEKNAHLFPDQCVVAL